MMRRLALLLTLLPGLALARTPHPTPKPPPELPAQPLTPPAMCEAAIASAEQAQKLPDRVLTSIALRESGRLDADAGRVRPWPWTINVEGVGHFFDSKEEAIAAVQAFQADGEASIDVGCMQVNLLHHPDAFANLDEAFDPTHNAQYGGRFLKGLFASMGDWGTAIAAYHSRTPGVGEPYRDQVVATWAPKDPAVLAKLSFQPLPPLPGSLGGSLGLIGGSNGTIGGTGMIYAPFAQGGPIQIAPSVAYRAFLPNSNVYQSFRPASVTYADFTHKMVRQKGRPLDLRLSAGLANSGRALVVPSGMLTKPSAIKQAVRRNGTTG